MVQVQQSRLNRALDALESRTAQHHEQTKRIHELFARLSQERAHLLHELTSLGFTPQHDSGEQTHATEEVSTLKAQYDEVSQQVEELRQQGLMLSTSQEQLLQTQVPALFVWLSCCTREMLPVSSAASCACAAELVIGMFMS